MPVLDAPPAADPGRFAAASMEALGAWTGRLPDGGRHALARRLGRVAPLFAPAKRRAVEGNLAVINAFSGGRVAPAQVFENFALTLSDFVSGARPEVLVDGRDKAEAARARGRGVVFLSSHLGPWELAASALAGWGWKASAVYQPYASNAMHDFIQKRRAAGIDYLAVGRGAAAGAARRLRRGEAVAFVADRPFGEEGAPVSLCGRTARLPRGPFVLACRTGAPALPSFMLRDRLGRLRLVIEDALEPAGRDPRDADELMRRFAAVLEKYISRHGEQWYCFEPVWEERRS